ncbi:peptide chain release factor N(5)-glutamine methyltransferase [Glaciecola petra]|uniref:Release factor glutamine methyltransferase n=1 Tax=Glaciecola petra TaxID=3075602 RepID=A0ABU2ZQX6_9ALTE|nr:peptide chain release factor N(5)-glutamine methyltransferase [Aestuariibacter sp. P117]MDT0594004.1 peptide chain release factor N(5)-glutamine methyltransferase [Aestuariibacter sp. P117]
MNKSVSGLLKWSAQIIADQPDLSYQAPALEARLMLEHVIQKNHAWMITNAEEQLSQDTVEHFEALLKQRINGKPLAFILGKQSFWDLELFVEPCTLIPRQDTETLIEAVLEHDFPDKTKVLDLGTGTGAIAIVLAKENPSWEISAVDKIVDAVVLAEKNAVLNKVKIDCHQSDWFSFFSKSNNIRFDLIVANPPYVESNSPYLQQGDLRFEPMSALASGADGLDDIRYIIETAQQYLNDDAFLFLEHGHEQHLRIAEILLDHGYTNIQHRHDYGKKVRVTYAKFRSN